MPFEPFDYDKLPPEGVYWVAGTRPVVDVRVNECGRKTRVPTGEFITFTALTWIVPYPNGDVEFDSIDLIHLEIGDDDVITHFAPLQRPPHPDH
ncbi:hypothetical protein [Azomonas macrocytogenes]|uniref:Uncharacterized protein n=1 Tax=Azomonas macrocytogenes TaxID=69962 RepID=A0A839TCD2_AZOMA|nr:hypothetical protein [Azomonas macrocytogenes]MBB3105263.1 hypothetical protein [Azomonas macrocytogenes]